MTDGQENIFEKAGITGLKPINPDDLKEFCRAMREEVIPETGKTIRRRQELANQVRNSGKILR